MIKKCDLCGAEFETKGGGKTCPACHTQPCAVCGKEVHLAPPALSKFKRQGFICCSRKCAAEHTRRMLMETEGITNVFQRKEVREKLSGPRHESEETHRRRCAANRETANRPEVIAKRKATNMERYGYAAPMQDKAIHDRMLVAAQTDEAKAKRRATMVERHGVVNQFQRPEILKKANESTATPEAKKKRELTLQSRYGVSSSYMIPEVREKCWDEDSRRKRIETSEERYGTEHPWQSDIVKEKIQSTSMARYGVPSPVQKCDYQKVQDYVDAHPGQSMHMIADALGVAYSTLQQMNVREGFGIKLHTSYFEDIVASFLDGLGVNYVRNDRAQIAPQELDFYCPDQRVAIEVNDLVTHNLDFNPYGGEPKPRGYHWEKTRACDEKGIRLIHCWEQDLPCSTIRSGRIGSWDVMRNVITHALGLSKNRVYARRTKVVEFPAADTKGFFDANNINGYRRARITYALVPKTVEDPTPDDILMAYAVGDAYFGKGRYDAEIARGACRLGYTVVGGASKLWRHIINHTDYGSIIYYTDRNYYDSNSMSFLDDVEYVGHSRSFWNYFVETGELRNRDPGHDSEIRQARRDGLVWEVENAGTDAYVWRRV